MSNEHQIAAAGSTKVYITTTKLAVESSTSERVAEVKEASVKVPWIRAQ